MSAIITARIWQHSPATDRDRLILLALADAADERGQVSMSVRRISDLTRIPRSSVAELLSGLIASDILRPVSGAKDQSGANVFRINLDCVPPPRPAELAPDNMAKLNAVVRTEGPKTDVTVSRKGTALSAPHDTEREPEKAPVQPEGQDEARAYPFTSIVATATAGRVEISRNQTMPKPKNPAFPPNMAGWMLDAARATLPDNLGPLYWYRSEHRQAAELMVERLGMDLAAVIDTLRAAQPVGPIHRITELEPLLIRTGSG